MRRRRDDGVAIVEAAFAIPILFMFLMALVDLGMWTFNSNQAANAARDGARTGIITYRTADVPGSADHNAIISAIEAHLPDRDITASDITIRCVNSVGTPVTGGCAAARPDTDRLKVDVRWVWNLITPIAGVVGTDRGEASGSATMFLVGQPVAGTPPVAPTTVPPPTTPPTTEPPPAPVACSLSSVAVTPHPIKPDKHGRVSDLVVKYNTNGAERCNGLAVQLTTPGGTVVSATCEVCESYSSHEWRYGSNDKIWTNGSGTVRIFNTYIDQSANFVVTG